MIYDKFKLPLIDFVERAEEIPNLVGVVLFGSARTGDISKKSDIDILLVFDCDHDPEVADESTIAHRIASEISAKYDLAHSFSFVFLNLKKPSETETDFLWNIAKEGILIWGKPEEVVLKKRSPALKPLIFCRYSIRDLKEKDRRRFLRRLYDSKKGLVNKRKERVAPGALLLKAQKFEKVKELFDEFNIRDYIVKKLWGH
jgi:predicted nucleotidyltransferase